MVSIYLSIRKLTQSSQNFLLLKTLLAYWTLIRCDYCDLFPGLGQDDHSMVWPRKVCAVRSSTLYLPSWPCDFICMSIAEENLNVKIVRGLSGLTTGCSPSHRSQTSAIWRALLCRSDTGFTPKSRRRLCIKTVSLRPSRRASSLPGALHMFDQNPVCVMISLHSISFEHA